MTDNNIVKFTGITKLNLSAPEMLRSIAEENPKNAFVICWPEDGSMPTYHSNTADTAVVLMRLQGFIHKFYNGDLPKGSRVVICFFYIPTALFFACVFGDITFNSN